MADISVTDIAPNGVAKSLAAGASTFTVPVAGEDRIYLEVANGGGSSINVTITKQTTSVTVPGEGPVTLANRVIAVANGASKLIGPFGASDIAADGKVYIALSVTTSVTVAAFRVPKAA